MKLIKCLAVTLLLLLAGVADANKSRRPIKDKKVPAKSDGTPTPSPANRLPTTYNGPAYASVPAPAPDAIVPVTPMYQAMLNQFAGEPEWAEQLATHHLNPTENVEHDPAHHWAKFWPALRGMDEETRNTFMKWMITSDCFGKHSYDTACESMIGFDAENRRTEAEKIAADLLKAEEKKIESEFSPRTAQGRADMLRVCRDTFSEKLELDLTEAETDFKERAKLFADAATTHSTTYANPGDTEAAAAAAAAAAAIAAKNKKKKRSEDDEENPKKKKPKKDGDGSGGSDSGSASCT